MKAFESHTYFKSMYLNIITNSFIVNQSSDPKDGTVIKTGIIHSRLTLCPAPKLCILKWFVVLLQLWLHGRRLICFPHSGGVPEKSVFARCGRHSLQRIQVLPYYPWPLYKLSSLCSENEQHIPIMLQSYLRDMVSGQLSLSQLQEELGIHFCISVTENTVL